VNGGPKKSKNKTRKAKDQTEYTPQQVYVCAIFELAIHTCDIKSGWRDTFERQYEYTRRDLFMGKLNPEKICQRLQDMNKYLDCIPIGKSIGAEKTQNAYRNALPYNEIRSIMGRAIPPEWSVNLLALGKDPCRFTHLDDPLSMYDQQWQADQQK
jgi:hypothetical protein